MYVRRLFSLSLVLSFVVLLAACGGGGEETTHSPEVSSTNGESTGGSGELVATVNFDGEAPEPEMYDASGNSECEKSSIESRKVVVNDNGTLKNVVVAVKSGPSGLNQSPESVTIDQENCMYEPHVATAKAGQSITYDDSDPSMHNVRATKDGRQIFNLTTFKGNAKSESFDSPGVYKLSCDVHPWMTGWVYVTDHGAAAVTDDSGEATLSNLPAGEYTLEFWHEEYGAQTETVTIEDGESASVSATFSS